MRYVIVYWSRFGNGRRIVKRLYGVLRERGDEVKVLDARKNEISSLPEADVYIFSSPAEKFTIPKDMRKLMKGLEGMEGKRYGIVNTHSLKRNWLGKMEKLLKKKKMVKVADVDFRVEGDVEHGDGLPEGWKSELENFVEAL